MSATSCRACGAAGLEIILSFGDMPLSNGLLTVEQLDLPEPRYPLDLAFCGVCALVQITVSVDPIAMFADYPYFSSTSTTMVAHAQTLVERLIEERSLQANSLAMEIASNDGYLLQFYVAAGVPALGIDPATNVVSVARERGIPTEEAFFGLTLAEELRASGKRASVLHANNVLAHVPDVNGVVAGIARVLADDGIAIIETPYVQDLIDHCEFDTIYHEHLFTYSLASLEHLFERNGLRIVDVERIAIHGGSLRAIAVPSTAGAPAARPAVARLRAEEAAVGLTSLDYYRDFATRVASAKDALRDLIETLRSEGHRIAAYGAAAKGATLLNATGIGRNQVEFVADRSEHKQGRFMPGVHIPIVGPEQLVERMPDDVILLTWNFADEILEQQAEYRRRGGRFIIPLPSPRVID